MSRKLRTTLPSYMKPNKDSRLERRLRQQKMKQKLFYDRTAKQLPPLLTNDVVRIKNHDGWKTKATVLQEVAPKSFIVRTEEGQVFKRNRRSLLKTQETFPEIGNAHILSLSPLLHLSHTVTQTVAPLHQHTYYR